MTILVGTDATPSSEAAVRWAAAEANRRGEPLRIMHAYGPEPGPVDGVIADALLDSALRQARPEPAAGIELRAVAQDPVPALLAAADVDLIVLGNRGRGGFASLLLGSVSERVATHARCPVVIVRGRADTADGPIVAGVDDSPAAEGVLAAAFAAAARHGCPLAVVRTYTPPTPLWVGDIPTAETTVPALDAAARERLEHRLTPFRAEYPQVDAEAVVSPDGAAAVLVAVSHDARLVVVGSRGHGPVVDALIGSTGRHLLHYAGCPVLIVRPVPVASTASGHGRAG